MGIPASRRSAIVFRRTCHTLGSGGLGFIEPSISWGVAAFSAPLELANGVEAQPATVDATMINNVPRTIKADFLSGDIGSSFAPWCAAQQIASILLPNMRCRERRLYGVHSYVMDYRFWPFSAGRSAPQKSISPCCAGRAVVAVPALEDAVVAIL